MNNEKKISLTFDLEQVTNDVLVKCNQISQLIREEAMEDIKANILEPDNPESRSIINRAVTEAFGLVKVLCQRYLKQGRTVDNNVLERMVAEVTYVKVQEKDGQEHPLFSCTSAYGTNKHVVWWNGDNLAWIDEVTGNQVTPDDEPVPIMEDTDEIDTITFEKIPVELYIPNFNVSVTDHLKSVIHKYVVDYIMWSFLKDQLADKAAEYKAMADGEDTTMIIRDLNARERFNFRKPSWV